MNKIQFDPKEGTTGFWGLRNVPERPNVTLTCDIQCEGDCGDFCFEITRKKEQLRQYGKALALCKSNRLKIVNPELLEVNPDELRPGLIMPLFPYLQFNEIDCDNCEGCGWYEGGPTLKTTCKYCNGTGQFIRLVPLTVKEEASESQTTEALIDDLWQLWDSLAECGELSIGPKFSRQYDDLKNRIVDFKLKLNEQHR